MGYDLSRHIVKQELNQAIQTALESREFLSEQTIGAMRKRKLPLETVVKLLHTMTGGSLNRELSNSGIEVSESAFSQRRNKIPSLGYKAMALERKGIQTAPGDAYRETLKRNLTPSREQKRELAPVR